MSEMLRTEDSMLDDPPANHVTPLRHPWRWVAVAVIAFLAVLLVQSLAKNKNIRWEVVGHYLFDQNILVGVGVTLALTVTSMVIGILLGTLLAVIRMSPNGVIAAVAGVYVWFFRGTPVLVQLIFWYNLGLLFPRLGIGIPFTGMNVSVETTTIMTGFIAGMLGLGLNEGAYMSEIVRAGILSVDHGQREAAGSLGLTPNQIMRKVILPQAMRVIIPPTGNNVISMLKTTSLVSVIAGSDLLTKAQNIYSISFQVIELLLVASVWYVVLTTVLSILQYFIEEHYSRGQRGPTHDSLLLRWSRNLVARRTVVSA